VTLLPGSDDPSADAVRRERLRFLLDALAQLPDDLAEVVQMRDLDGLDYREIADLLGLPDGTVKSRLNRARVELARIVRERIGATPLSRGPLFSALTPQPGGGA
jgi:RNA polymerase sigma-70 factor (ECF subfamily)